MKDEVSQKRTIRALQSELCNKSSQLLTFLWIELAAPNILACHP